MVYLYSTILTARFATSSALNLAPGIPVVKGALAEAVSAASMGDITPMAAATAALRLRRSRGVAPQRSGPRAPPDSARLSVTKQR